MACLSSCCGCYSCAMHQTVGSISVCEAAFETGEQLGGVYQLHNVNAAHNFRPLRKKSKVISHNLRGYDAFLL